MNDRSMVHNERANTLSFVKDVEHHMLILIKLEKDIKLRFQHTFSMRLLEKLKNTIFIFAKKLVEDKIIFEKDDPPKEF